MELRLLFPWVLCNAVFLRLSSALLKGPKDNGRPKSALQQRLPFYHSSNELHEDMVEAIAGCNSSIRASLSQGGANLDVVRLSAAASGKSRQQKRKALLIFGEHARELVGPESALHFIRGLCGLEPSIPQDRAAAALSVADFVIVPNANPSSRRAVETGAFCKRTNEHGVDLNRNWGDKHRDKSAHIAMTNDKDDSTLQEQNPGPSGFSEPETQALRDLARETGPDVFLAVHSGAYLLGMPFGYSAEPQPEHAQQMMDILGSISSEHCGGQCPYGALESVINYASPGCAMDYMVEDLKVPFAFTFEIYSGGKNSEMAGTDGGGFEGFASGFMNAGGSAVLKGVSESKESHEKRMQEDATESDERCLEQFNPTDEDTFHSLLDNWSGAYIDLVTAVDKVLTPRMRAATATTDASMDTGLGSDASPSPRYKLEVDNTKSDVSLSPSDSPSDDQEDVSTESDSLGRTSQKHPKGPAPTLSPEEWAKATAVSGSSADDGHMDVFAHKLHDVFNALHDDAAEDTQNAGQADQDKEADDNSSGVDLSLKTASADALSEFLHPRL